MKKPKVLLLRLTERRSADGGLHLSGMCGGARLVGYRAREPDAYGNMVWEVYTQEPEPRPLKNGL